MMFECNTDVILVINLGFSFSVIIVQFAQVPYHNMEHAYHGESSQVVCVIDVYICNPFQH